MSRLTDNKVILVTQKTRLENLIHRYNTESQAQFYVEHHGGSFEDYRLEHNRYHAALAEATGFLETYGRLQVIDRDYVPRFVFGERDVVVALGRDGLVANIMKYLTAQPLVGVNPDPQRWDGILLPFQAADLIRIVPEVFAGRRQCQSITFAEATLSDGQCLCGVNDLFIGQRTHASARYQLHMGNTEETQSSSGIIVSTGLGATGWMKSVLAGAGAISRFFGAKSAPALPSDFSWSSDSLYYSVREPYPSKATGASMVFGKIEKSQQLQVTSLMAENGTIFGDGVEEDFLSFNAGTVATIGVADKKGQLVV